MFACTLALKTEENSLRRRFSVFSRGILKKGSHLFNESKKCCDMNRGRWAAESNTLNVRHQGLKTIPFQSSMLSATILLHSSFTSCTFFPFNHYWLTLTLTQTDRLWTLKYTLIYAPYKHEWHECASGPSDLRRLNFCYYNTKLNFLTNDQQRT